MTTEEPEKFFTYLNDTNYTSISTDSKWVPLDTFIGLILAFSSCFFIGFSVIFKKLALNDIEARGRTRAVDGGYGYLRIPRWWLGISLMALGELTNFFAYIFAPAILVTPLGVFSIVCTAALSPYFLKESLNSLGKLGCILVLVGCMMVTLCGPKDREVETMEDLQSQLLHPGFLIYASIVTISSFVLMALVPRYGHKYVMLYISICSSFGSLSVMFAKGIGLALKVTIGGKNEFTNWATWVCLSSLILCLLIETIYMQRALDLFNSSLFMSVNYVMFTSLVIVASSILYTELREIGWKNILLTILGFVVNIGALYLIHIDKEYSRRIPEEPTNNNLPNTTTGTPLLQKENKKFLMKVQDPESGHYISNVKPTINSALLPVTLTPSLLNKGNKLISFMNKDSQSSLSEESNKEKCQSPQIQSYSNSSDDKPSCSSISNSSSIICLPEDPVPSKLINDINGPTNTSYVSNQLPKITPSQCITMPKIQSSSGSEIETGNTALRDSISDADEATRLV